MLALIALNLLQATPGPLPIDFEKRWQQWSRLTPEEVDQAWLDDHGLLEMFVIYKGDGHALSVLHREDAPEWVRCAVWVLSSPDSHMRSAAAGWLVDTSPGRVRAWLERHPQVADRCRAFLEYQKITAAPLEAAPHYLPPLDRAEIFALLVPGDEVLDLESGARPRAGMVYLFQVKRTLRAWVKSGQYDALWVGQVADLLDHPRGEIARAAAWALGGAPDGVKPHGRLRSVYVDIERTVELRQAALVAWSMWDHPRVYFALLDLVRDPAHDLWATAVSRMQDIGDGFVYETLTGVSPRAADAAIYSQALQALHERRAATHGKRLAQLGETLLERTAWADLSCNAYEIRYKAWSLNRLRTPDAALHAGLEHIQSHYEFSKVGGPEPLYGDMTSRVRSYARQLLEGPE